MKNLTFQNLALTRELFGHHNHNLDKICEALDVTINTRGNALLVSGKPEDINRAEKLIKELYHLLEGNFSLEEADIDAAINTIKNNNNSNLKKIFLTTVYKTVRNKAITPRNPAQQKYVEAIQNNDLLISIGPAGTGKTYLAMAMAMAAFSKGDIKKLF